MLILQVFSSDTARFIFRIWKKYNMHPQKNLSLWPTYSHRNGKNIFLYSSQDQSFTDIHIYKPSLILYFGNGYVSKELVKVYKINDYFHLTGCFILPFILGISKYLSCGLTYWISHVCIPPDVKQKKKVKFGTHQVVNIKSNIIN